MLVSVANWLRWPRLANAWPRPGLLTHCPNTAVAPKYCSKPSTALTTAAASHAAAETRTKRSPGASPGVRPKPKPETPTKTSAQAQENSSGPALGEGPKANGFSHGSVIRRKGKRVAIRFGIKGLG